MFEDEEAESRSFCKYQHRQDTFSKQYWQRRHRYLSNPSVMSNGTVWTKILIAVINRRVIEMAFSLSCWWDRRTFREIVWRLIRRIMRASTNFPCRDHYLSVCQFNMHVYAIWSVMSFCSVLRNVSHCLYLNRLHSCLHYILYASHPYNVTRPCHHPPLTLAGPLALTSSHPSTMSECLICTYIYIYICTSI